MSNLVYKKWSQDVGVRAIDEAFGNVKHPGEEALSGGDYSYEEEIFLNEKDFDEDIFPNLL